MRRILLSCASIAVLTLPAAASARAHRHPAPGFLVVRKAAGDGGVNGAPVLTVVVQGFVLGRVSREAQVSVYHLPSAAGGGVPRAAGPDVSRSSIRWHGVGGQRYEGSGFRFSAMGGAYRVVVRGSGVYLFAGGQGSVTLRGSSVYPHADGKYSIDGGAFRSLPGQPVRRAIGGG